MVKPSQFRHVMRLVDHANKNVRDAAKALDAIACTTEMRNLVTKMDAVDDMLTDWIKQAIPIRAELVRNHNSEE